MCDGGYQLSIVQYTVDTIQYDGYSVYRGCSTVNTVQYVQCRINQVNTGDQVNVIKL